MGAVLEVVDEARLEVDDVLVIEQIGEGAACSASLQLDDLAGSWDFLVENATQEELPVLDSP